MIALLLLACNDFQMTAEITYVEPVIEALPYRTEVQGIDIVMVLDSSCSMTSDLNHVNEQAKLLARDMATLPQPYWRFTVIEAENDNPYQLTWSDPFTSNLENAVVSQLQAVEHGAYSNGEQGLAASYRFMTDYEWTRQTRPEFNLYWIFVSDEEDSSGIATEDWLQVAASIKASPAQVMAGALTGHMDCNNYEVGIPEARYTAVSDVKVDMCGNDYTGILQPLRDAYVAVQEPVWELKAIPQEDSITLWQGDLEIDTWTYTASDNSIRLTSVPAESTTYIVTYYEATE